MNKPASAASSGGGTGILTLRWVGIIVTSALVAAGLAVWGPARTAIADTAQSEASNLSDRAFALLNSVNADATVAGPMLGPVANLASDAQTLSTALNKGDRAEAAHAMAAIVADRDAIDAAPVKGSRALDLGQWKTLKDQIASLEKQVHPVPGPSGPRVPTAAAPSGADLPAAPAPPRVVINSRVFTGGSVRIKGFFEGTDLKSAGIYDDSLEVKPIDVGANPGSQRVNFDFSLEDPSPAESIDVADNLGRVARAQVAPQASMVARSPDGHEKLIELGSGGAEDAVASAGPPAGPRNDTAEIPRADEDDSDEPHRRIPGGVGGNLRDVQINVIGVMPVVSQPGSYEVVGQISGAGVKRAAIYVDGKLAKPIPVSAGAYSSFDVTFAMMGRDAAIRAYGNGTNFVEASLDTSNNGMTVYNVPRLYPPNPNYPNNPYAYGNPYAPPNPYGYAVPPYGAPYGTTPPPSVPWWRRILP